MDSVSNSAAIRPVDMLRITPFRLLWLNSFVFILVQSTQRFAFVWLALGLGAKSDISGFILFVMGVPALLISLPVGVMSDHMNRRRILMVSQIGALVITIAIAGMVTLDYMTIRWAILGSFISGIFIALGTPVRSAIVPTLVPSDKLVGAIAISTIGNNFGLIIGPIAAGPAISQWGIGGAFWLQSVLYALGFLTLIPLRLPSIHNPERRELRQEIFGGLSFIQKDAAVRSFFVLLAGSVIFMIAPWMVLGPQIAKEQAGASGSQTTVLFAMLGVGQLVTSTLIMRFNHKMIKKGLWFMCGLCWGGSIQMLLGQSSSLIGMGIFLFAWGMGGGFYMNLSQTLIQNNTPPQVMGRVMAFHSLLISGLAPMAALLVGVIARKLDNAPLTFSCSGALMLILAVYFTATKKHLRPLA